MRGSWTGVQRRTACEWVAQGVRVDRMEGGRGLGKGEMEKGLPIHILM